MALLDSENQIVAKRICEQGIRGETMHEILDELFLETQSAPSDLAAICIGTGPGSFTGIRVGVAMAQGLAFAKRLPLYPFSSLQAMILSAKAGLGSASQAGSASSSNGDSSVISAISASGGRYFISSWILDKVEEKLCTLNELVEYGSEAKYLIVSGKIPDRPLFEKSFPHIFRMEEKIDFSTITKFALSQDPILDGILRPNYLQASAAEEKKLQSPLLDKNP